MERKLSQGRFTFDSKQDMPDWSRECALCGFAFSDGDKMDVVALMPNDDENLHKMLDGKPHTTQGCFVHSKCVAKRVY